MAEQYALVFGTADGWGNYPVDGEGCRVWSGFVNRGIKPENIIYMGYKNNVKHVRNPFPGKIFVGPASTTDGDWAKYGCFEHVDYTEKDVNAEVFLGILSGDAERVKAATGIENPRVLAAGPEDTVFIYFIDHGDEDIIVVGKDYVTSEELLDALKTAHEKKIYGKFVWYMEACFSGSMFSKLPADWNIYVMTAADSEHEAEMADCPPDDIIAGRVMNTCIGSLWDDSYLDYLEDHPDCTIGELFDFVHEDVAKTSDQNVSEWGDMTFRDLKLGEFVGYPQKTTRTHKKSSSTTTVSLSEVPAHLAKWSAIRAGSNAEAEVAMKKYQEIIFAEAKKEIEVMKLGRELLGEKGVNKAVQSSTTQYSVECVRDLSISLADKCGHTFPFSMTTTNVLRAICTPGASTPNVDFAEIC